MNGIKNVPLKKFKKFLEKPENCKCIRISVGHFIYSRNDLYRPFPIQTHVDPVPNFIVKNAMRWLGYKSKEKKEEFFIKLSQF
jgi:hypothetical protein